MDKKLKVLIADANQTESEKLAETLADELEIASVVNDGVRAVEDIMKHHPDVVVIDTMLPMIDGLGVIEKCREKLSDKDMPSFIVTTFIGTQKLIECINHMEVDYCIMKPFQPDILLHRIEQITRMKYMNQQIQYQQRREIRDSRNFDTAKYDIRQDVTKIIREESWNTGSYKRVSIHKRRNYHGNRRCEYDELYYKIIVSYDCKEI